MTATLRHPATPADLLSLTGRHPPALGGDKEAEMIQSHTEPETTAVLTGWIGRKDLADALGVTVDTLGRWEARRVGPPCVRAGRKVLYRRRAVQDWLAGQERPRATKAGGRT